MNSQVNLPNRYAIIQTLGKGHTGQTNLARLVHSDTMRVIKHIYRPEEPLDPLTQRLRTVSQHPQLPTLLDSWQTDEGQFFAFEHIASPPIDQAEPLPWSANQVQTWLLAMLPVLEHLHSFRLVHGDIKPANIRPGPPTKPLPTLVDFRITQRLQRQNPTLATTGGDAAYASPEQALGTLVYGSDLYSLGLVAVHLLTGFAPFDLYSAADNRWIWPDLISQPLPKTLSQVLHKLLQRSLERRYARAEDVIRDLKQSPSQALFTKARSFLPGKKSLFGALQPITVTRPTPLAPAVDTINWQPLCQLHTGIVTALALRNNILAMGTNGGQVLVCDLADATDVQTLGRGHRDRTTALAFHPQQPLLYSASKDGTVKCWDLNQGTLMETLGQPGWQPTDLAITDAYLIVSDGTGVITVRSLDSLKIDHQF
ncbi:MAG: hypothetical protein AAFY17_13745, partial [Cyanobacteria bacterium J06642_11]